MAISVKQRAAADRRAASMKAKFPEAVSVRHDRRGNRVVIGLVSGIELGLIPSRIPGLESAKPSDLQQAEITPSGFGIHFPSLNVDIYIPSLIMDSVGPRRRSSQRRRTPAHK